MNTKYLSLLVMPLFWAGCASTMHDSLLKIKPGMDKSAVLEIAGSPSRTQRSKNKDTWTYIFYQDNQPTGMDVTFEDGQVISKRRAILDPAKDSLARQAESDKDFQDYQNLLKEKRSRSKTTDLEEL